MADYTLSEFLYWIRVQDREVSVLVVEGIRDTRCWALFVPDEERGESIVIPIERIDIPPQPGGHRGKALYLAQILRETDIEDRVCIFIDADNDYILGNEHDQPVLLTDFRDLESYGLSHDSIKIIVVALGKSDESSGSCANCISEIGQRLGILHAANENIGAGLPLSSSIINFRDRIFKKKKGSIVFNFEKLVNIAFEESSSEFSDREYFKNIYTVFEDRSNLDYRFCVRGKDAALILSVFTGKSYEECLSVLHFSVLSGHNEHRNHNNFSFVEKFLSNC